MTPAKFTPKFLDTILEEARAALAPVAERHGLVLQRKHCSYQSSEAPVAFKFVVPERNEDGSAISPSETEFRRYASRFGLDPESFGQAFNYNGVDFRICGIKPKARRLPVLARNFDGKVYSFTAKVVLSGLEVK